MNRRNWSNCSEPRMKRAWWAASCRLSANSSNLRRSAGSSRSKLRDTCVSADELPRLTRRNHVEPAIPAPTYGTVGAPTPQQLSRAVKGIRTHKGALRRQRSATGIADRSDGLRPELRAAPRPLPIRLPRPPRADPPVQPRCRRVDRKCRWPVLSSVCPARV